jgi:CheY-like chemotaxis protein
MGGDLTVRSEPGRGTTFSFQVPLSVATGTEALRGDRKVMGLEPGQDHIRVLVVDDKWENRELMTRLLRSVGFQVREAANGAEAVDVWGDWHPHLIWMDIRMPVMDGLEATRRIRAAETMNDERGTMKEEGSSEDESSVHRSPATPVPFIVHRFCKIVALTASAFEHDREAVLAAGCDDFLAKPFRESSVFEKMAVHLGVRYTLEGAERAEPQESEAAGSLPTDVSSLPADLRRQLRDAAEQGDVAGAYGLVADIRERNGALADHVTVLLREYRFDELLELMTRGE